MREQQRAQKEWDKDEHREKRVNSWRDFMSQQKTKKKKSGLKSAREGPALWLRFARPRSCIACVSARYQRPCQP